MTHKKIGLVFVCSDNRFWTKEVQSYLAPAIDAWLGVEAHDVIALPGPDCLCGGDRTKWLDVAAEQAALLIGAHSISEVGHLWHQKCAGHPVSDDEHIHDELATVHALKERLANFSGTIKSGCLAYASDSEWTLRPSGEV